MSELVASCIAELDDDLPYLRHPLALLTTIITPDRLDVEVGDKLIGVAERMAGLVLFVAVVLPLGVVGKVIRVKVDK
jgi:hypothetical protein